MPWCASAVLEDAAKKVLRIEADAIAALIGRIDARFSAAVELLAACNGRVVVTGMGKSGLIGKKIAATLASTGTPAFFLHPAEGVHGDLGMVARGDVVLALSNSGETEELIKILPTLKRLDVKLVSLTGNPRSTVARHSDIVLDVSVKEEAGPLGLVPTASTTATLAMGDALAVGLIERRGFRQEDFAYFHPGGAIGKQLLLRVADVMHTGDAVPRVFEDRPLKDAIYEISSKKLGMTVVVTAAGALAGVITDGDLRRLMERESNPLQRRTAEVMTRAPRAIEPQALAAQAVQIMERHAITSLVVVEAATLVGVVHLHDLLKRGVV